MASQRRSHGCCQVEGCWESDNGHRTGRCPWHRGQAVESRPVPVQTFTREVDKYAGEDSDHP